MCLMFLDDLRLERSVSVAGNVEFKLPDAAFHRLGGFAVFAVSELFGKMGFQFCFQSRFGQLFDQRGQHSVFAVNLRPSLDLLQGFI